MPRFELIVSSRPHRAAGAPAARRFALGGAGGALASIAAALLAVGVVVTALVLGYLIAGLVIAAVIVAIVAVLLRSAFRALRR